MLFFLTLMLVALWMDLNGTMSVEVLRILCLRWEKKILCQPCSLTMTFISWQQCKDQIHYSKSQSNQQLLILQQIGQLQTEVEQHLTLVWLKVLQIEVEQILTRVIIKLHIEKIVVVMWCDEIYYFIQDL